MLIGDVAPATPLDLGQRAGMAIGDAVVLASQIVMKSDLETARRGDLTRRFERCRYLCEAS